MTQNIHSRCITSNISPERTANIITTFHDSIGWDAVVEDVTPSAPLSAGTWDEIVKLSAAALLDAGLDVTVEETQEWHEHLGDIHAQDAPLIKNLPAFLKHFKRYGILISICTSDDRRSTEACMRNWNIGDLVDFSICGDEVTESKPSASPLLELCDRAGVLPSECIVIGDTSSDTGMGRNGGAGLVVGVLTGSGTEKQLIETGAHVVLPNIGYLPDFLENKALRHELSEQDLAALDDSENIVSMKVTAS